MIAEITALMILDALMPKCDMRSDQVMRLERFRESQVDWRLLPTGILIEFWISDSTGTWTLLETNPVGISCVIETGEGAVSRQRKL